MNAAALTFSQLRYVNKAYWRSPAQAFFAIVYPLMFLVIFTSIFRSSNIQFGAKQVNEATFYVPGMAALAVITVCFNNIAAAVTFQRDSGVLKRIDGTPCPARRSSAPGSCTRCSCRYCWWSSRPRSGARSTALTSPPGRPCCGCW